MQKTFQQIRRDITTKMNHGGDKLDEIMSCISEAAQWQLSAERNDELKFISLAVFAKMEFFKLATLHVKDEKGLEILQAKALLFVKDTIYSLAKKYVDSEFYFLLLLISDKLQGLPKNIFASQEPRQDFAQLLSAKTKYDRLAVLNTLTQSLVGVAIGLNLDKIIVVFNVLVEMALFNASKKSASLLKTFQHALEQLSKPHHGITNEMQFIKTHFICFLNVLDEQDERETHQFLEHAEIILPGDYAKKAAIHFSYKYHLTAKFVAPSVIKQVGDYFATLNSDYLMIDRDDDNDGRLIVMTHLRDLYPRSSNFYKVLAKLNNLYKTLGKIEEEADENMLVVIAQKKNLLLEGFLRFLEMLKDDGACQLKHMFQVLVMDYRQVSYSRLPAERKISAATIETWKHLCGDSFKNEQDFNQRMFSEIYNNKKVLFEPTYRIRLALLPYNTQQKQNKTFILQRALYVLGYEHFQNVGTANFRKIAKYIRERYQKFAPPYLPLGARMQSSSSSEELAITTPILRTPSPQLSTDDDDIEVQVPEVATVVDLELRDIAIFITALEQFAKKHNTRFQYLLMPIVYALWDVRIYYEQAYSENGISNKLKPKSIEDMYEQAKLSLKKKKTSQAATVLGEEYYQQISKWVGEFESVKVKKGESTNHINMQV